MIAVLAQFVGTASNLLQSVLWSLYCEIVYYTVALVAVSFALGPVAHMGWIYMITAAVTGAVFLYLVTRLWGQAQMGVVTGRDAMRVFRERREIHIVFDNGRNSGFPGHCGRIRPKSLSTG